MKALALALLAAGLAAAPAPNPVRWELMEAPSKPVKAGARFNLRLIAHIEQGWHLYSTKLIPDGPIATRIWLAQGQPFELAGPVKSPEPLRRHDPSFNLEVEYHQGDTTFVLPVKVLDSAAGQQTLIVSSSYQICSDKVCLPPRTVKSEVPIFIRK